MIRNPGAPKDFDLVLSTEQLAGGDWHPASVADQDFIAAARNALPKLIAEVRRLRRDSGDTIT